MLDLIIDGQYGSTGKGKLAAYLCEKHSYAAAVCEYSSNAGHTAVLEGKKHVLRQLPVAVLDPECALYIGPGAAIDVDLLLQEVDRYDAGDRLHIHHNAAIITKEDIEIERGLTSIASTMKGCGSALARKVMRQATLAGSDSRLSRFVGKFDTLHDILLDAPVLGETAQGFSLCNNGPFYPRCTAKTMSTGAFLDRLGGIHPDFLGDTYLCVRTFPIRVGNIVHDGVEVGTSGGHYADQHEVKWEDIPGNVTPETTTVTGRVRRVFTWSREQYLEAFHKFRPDFVFLNFVNYLDPEVSRVREDDTEFRRFQAWNLIQEKVYDLLVPNETDRIHPVAQILLGTGAAQSEMLTIDLDRTSRPVLSVSTSE